MVWPDVAVGKNSDVTAGHEALDVPQPASPTTTVTATKPLAHVLFIATLSVP
jgi:hypothetical protein